MRTAGIFLVAAVAAAGFAADPAPPPAAFPKFKTQEIDAGLSIGYAVLVADLNGDKKPDIVVVDQLKVVWYENPTWKKRVILDGKTKPDNVCAAAVDVDGDGQLDLVVGAGWKPFDTANPGTLQWLKRGKSIDDEWTLFPIPCDEPTVHRLRAFDLDGDGKPEIVHVPLMGRDATAKGNWLDGRPVRVMAYQIPKEPQTAANWKPTVVVEDLHVMHNFHPVALPGKKAAIFATSYEGVSLIGRLEGGKWGTILLDPADQSNPKGNRGASEIKHTLMGEAAVIATVEPWHGNQVVVYTQNPKASDLNRPLTRHVIDDQLRWGHAVSFADLDGDGTDELVIGVRDDPNPKAGDTFTERRGVRVYKNADGKGAKWERMLLDPGGVAVEDLAVADLDGDGKPDIVACGRATKNVRIYWNQGK